MSNKKKNIFEKISTKPNYYSTVWKGKRSVLSTVLLWCIWFLRIFSLLQILKLVFRTVVTWLKKGTTDTGSKRVNVPPVFVELYYIAWLAVMIVCNRLSLFSLLGVRIAAIYFVAESIIWVLYYTIFRRFYEETYSLYHILEYFVVLFILVPTQGLALGGICDYPFLEALSGLVGAANDSTPIIIRIMGALNAAIVVALTINSFPTEDSKTKNKIQENYIIGCGDVVKNRLFPALKMGGADDYTLHVYDIRDCDEKDLFPYLTVIKEDRGVIPSVDKHINNRSVIWIETPVSSHYDLLEQALHTDAALVVLEKPITDDRESLIKIRALVQNDDLRKRIFFLSYYLLEKALPLYYIAFGNAAYKKYLNISDSEIVDNFRSLIGSLKSVRIDILEGPDYREGLFDGIKGQLFETFIHNMILASLFTGLPKYWKATNINYEDLGENEPKIITMTAKSGNADISMRQGKFVPVGHQKRFAEFKFENGYIYADLEQKITEIGIDSLGRKAEVSVKDTYDTNYSVMTSLVHSVFTGENSSEEVDGLRNQIEIIEFFLDYLDGQNT